MTLPPEPAGSPRGSAASAPTDPPTVEQLLFSSGYNFDIFQAIKILERLQPQRVRLGRDGPPNQEVVRFRSRASTAFPASSIYEVIPPLAPSGMPLAVVNFMGLTGPSGVMPRHYTEMLIRIERDSKHPEKTALRDWLALFDHRLISFFFRAWEKYHFTVAYARGEFKKPEPDLFTRVLFSLIGMGQPTLRQRMQIAIERADPTDEMEPEQVLGRINDLGLLYYAGLLAQRPRNAYNLEALIRGYFRLPAQVVQFQEQWLYLDVSDQTQLGSEHNTGLGVNVVVGQRVRDLQSKFRIRVGPLRYEEFLELLPDHFPIPIRKSFFLLSHLIRLFVGPEYDFDVQLVLRKEDVPVCQLSTDGGLGPRLGWNTWIHAEPCQNDVDDAVFVGEAIRWLSLT